MIIQLPQRAVSSAKSSVKVHLALVGSTLLDEPLIAIYALLSMILKKDLNATLFQITLLTMLRPTMALLSFYWGSFIKGRRGKLKSNLLIAGILERAPFLLLPFIDNVWFIIFAASCYTLFHRAGMPALMELLKINLEGKKRNSIFAQCSAIGYAEGIVLGLALGKWMDLYPASWRSLFFFGALLSLVSVFLRSLITAPPEQEKEQTQIAVKETILEKIINPWINSFKLLRERPDFMTFQMGFMICGFGLMIILPAIPFFLENISYFDFVVGMTIFKGIGYVLTTPIWSKALERFHPNRLIAVLCLFFGLYALFLAFTTFNLYALYIAYFLYGISQAGSRLIWHLSGPLFSKKEESAQFSTVNILTVGLRGLVAPLCGFALCKYVSPISALVAGTICCFYGALFMLRRSKEFSFKEIKQL